MMTHAVPVCSTGETRQGRAGASELFPKTPPASAGEEVVAAAVVEVQVGVDDDVDAGEVEALLAQRPEAGIHVGHRRVRLRHPGVDQHARLGMVDDVHVDRHPLALDVQVGHEDRRDRDRGGGVHRIPTAEVVVDT